MCMLPSLCFCCSFSEVIDTMMVFKHWAPGVMCVCVCVCVCVWCRGPDGPSEGYREAKGNWGRALLCFARQHKADHRHWPWPVGTIGWITYSPTACTEQRSGTDMCVCVCGGGMRTPLHTHPQITRLLLILILPLRPDGRRRRLLK